MAINASAFVKLTSEMIKSDRLRREREVKGLMANGMSWEDAYRQVNFPNMTKERWDRMCTEYDKAFGTQK